MTSTMKIEGGIQVWRNAEGQIHRLDGPAVIHPDRSESWYVDGKRHRLDGPAFIGVNGSQYWYVNDNLHRLDGPAIIRPNGTQAWYVGGNLVDPGFISIKIKHNPPTPKEQQLLMEYWGEGSS